MCVDSDFSFLTFDPNFDERAFLFLILRRIISGRIRFVFLVPFCGLPFPPTSRISHLPSSLSSSSKYNKFASFDSGFVQDVLDQVFPGVL